MRKLVLLFISAFFAVSARGQTTIIYNFDVTGEGIYLVERIEKTVQGTTRKQVIETPLFLRDTAGVSGYLNTLRQRQAELSNELGFLRQKTKVLEGMADSLFFRPNIIAKQ